MENITSNIIPIILATLSSFAVGYFWYGPLFGDLWMKLNGFNKEQLMKEMQDKNGMVKKYGLTFLASFFIILFMAMHMGNRPAGIAIPASIMNALALVALGTLPHYLFESKKFSHWLINAGYTMVMVIIAAVLISVL